MDQREAIIYLQRELLKARTEAAHLRVQVQKLTNEQRKLVQKLTDELEVLRGKANSTGVTGS